MDICKRGTRRGAREWTVNGSRWLILSGEGKRVPTKIRYSKIRLQVAPSCCQTYIMASFKQSQNYNGAGIVLRIVMAFFENPKTVMAQNKLTLNLFAITLEAIL